MRQVGGETSSQPKPPSSSCLLVNNMNRQRSYSFRPEKNIQINMLNRVFSNLCSKLFHFYLAVRAFGPCRYKKKNLPVVGLISLIIIL